jgi:hypothetical protein
LFLSLSGATPMAFIYQCAVLTPSTGFVSTGARAALQRRGIPQPGSWGLYCASQRAMKVNAAIGQQHGRWTQHRYGGTACPSSCQPPPPQQQESSGLYSLAVLVPQIISGCSQPFLAYCRKDAVVHVHDVSASDFDDGLIRSDSTNLSTGMVALP